MLQQGIAPAKIEISALSKNPELLVSHKKLLMGKCFYNTKNCASKITKEHVISKTVLKECFGEKIRNAVTAEIFGEKVLFDHEHIVKDVCKTCNETLSPYDVAGQRLIKHIMGWHNGPLQLPVNKDFLNWLIKTHLNFFRVIKDRETNSAYPIKQIIKIALIRHRNVPSNLYQLLVQEWEDNGDYWNSESPDRIPFFSYRSIRYRKQHIVLSNLRLRNFDTILMLPSNKNYKNFQTRVDSCIEEVKSTYGYEYQTVDTNTVISKSILNINSLFTIEQIEKLKQLTKTM